VLPGGTYSLHSDTKAQMLSELAMGPNVPAARGQAVEANHQRLQKLNYRDQDIGYVFTLDL
jgi:hypothetical protein